MPARRTGYNDTTLRQIQELKEEYTTRVINALNTWNMWKGREEYGHREAEYGRQLRIIYAEIREQLQILVGPRIPKIENGLTGAFDAALKGYRPPSRSRSREGRWRHPIENNSELEQV